MARDDTHPQAQARRDGLTANKNHPDEAADASNAIEKSTLTPGAPAAEDRQERIAKAAYSKAEQRGFAPGGEWDDWLNAEREIDQDVEQLTTRSSLPDE